MFALMDEGLIDHRLAGELAEMVDGAFDKVGGEGVVESAQRLIGEYEVDLVMPTMLALGARLLRRVHPVNSDEAGVVTAERLGSLLYEVILSQPDRLELGVGVLTAVYNDGNLSDLASGTKRLIESSPRDDVVMALVLGVMGLGHVVSILSDRERSGDAIRLLALCSD